MVALNRNSKTLKIDHDLVIYVRKLSHSAKMNDGWNNTKKNLKDFRNEQLRNEMVGINVEKALDWIMEMTPVHDLLKQ